MIGRCTNGVNEVPSMISKSSSLHYARITNNDKSEFVELHDYEYFIQILRQWTNLYDMY